MISFLKKNKEVSILLMVALIVRLVILPFAQNVEADATSRIMIAEDLINNFRIIRSGHWPSLQFYFNALFIFIFQDRVLGPKILGVLLGAACVVPFYLFTQNLFNKRGAFFSALLFTLSPVIVRNSYHALAEIYYICFSVFAFYFISEVLVKNEHKTRNALLAGFFITLAAGGRFEAWLFIGFIGVWLLMVKEFKSLLFFLLTASVFPLFWLWGSYIDYGDMLYSLHMVEKWNFEIEGVNEGLDKTELIKRFFFYPLSWFVVLTPIAGLIILWSIYQSIVSGFISKYQKYFLAIATIMMLIFVYKCLNGSLVIAFRFTVTIAFLWTPFYALLFDEKVRFKWKDALSVVVLCLVIPSSYGWHLLPIDKVFFMQERIKNAIGIIKNTTYPQSQPIPRLVDQSIVEDLAKINLSLEANDGLLLDFISWEGTYFLSEGSNLPFASQFVQVGGAHAEINWERMKEVLTEHPTGVIVLKDFSSFSEKCVLKGAILHIPTIGKAVSLQPIRTNKLVRIFKYRVVDTTQLVQDESLVPLFVPTKDVDYYMDAIRSNSDWYYSIIQKAKEKGISVEESLRLDAEYMVEMDKQK